MTGESILSADASLTKQLTWDNINWLKAIVHVRRLQMRIAKAFQAGKHRKAKALQWILTHSFYAKLLAVKRVVTNKGAKTPGVDGVTWNTPSQKMKAAISLKRHGYQTLPLKRIYIPKKGKLGKQRPLSIPAMKCRAQQALHLLSLEPIAETIADKNAYGFRPFRSTADAIQQCFTALALKASAQFILEGDIKSCFDEISHKFLVATAPMDKEILKKWLAAGYVDNKKLYPTEEGVGQGSVISPTLLTVTLSGLESAVRAVSKPGDKVNIVTYADDFIITGATKELLETTIKPVVIKFLGERGLTLSEEKTKITHIDEGFDFLGFNVRKYKGKLIITPAKNSVKRFLAEIRETIKQHKASKTEVLILLLNQKISGWANYYRHVCSKKTFSYVDYQIFEAIRRWTIRRHPGKGITWVNQKYFRHEKLRNWIFFAKIKDSHGKPTNVELTEASKTPIVRHIKIRAKAIPYDAAFHEYFEKLIAQRKIVTGSKTAPAWDTFWWRLF